MALAVAAYSIRHRILKVDPSHGARHGVAVAAYSIRHRILKVSVSVYGTVKRG